MKHGAVDLLRLQTSCNERTRSWRRAPPHMHFSLGWVSITAILSFLLINIVHGIRRVGVRAVEPLALGSTGKERMRLGFEA